jgi:hypothetical protein
MFVGGRIIYSTNIPGEQILQDMRLLKKRYKINESITEEQMMP